MAEVAEGSSPDLKVLSVRHFEATPANQSQELVDPESTYATTKEEEWVTKKKTELTTTRQIETRVKRQVVLEDGKVVDDTGPIVTTNTTEDTEKQESKQTEHRTLGDDPSGEDWVAVAGPSGTVKEVKERKVTTREEKEERVETEDVQHLGDITDEEYLTAVKSQQDVRLALREAREENLQQSKELVSASGPRVVHQSTKSHKVIDTEDSQELSQLQPDGRLVTETRRTTEHEEVHDTEEPDDVDAAEGSETEETFKESSSRFAKTKDQDIVEYLADGVKIGEEMRYVAENVEGERRGDPDLADQEWDSLSTRIRRMRRQSAKARGIPAAVGHLGEPTAVSPLDRKDALTKKPLDFDQEEETRKVETSKWLEHHFGSDSRSSKDSIEDDDAQATGGNTSFINVTMKSRPISGNRKVSSLTSPSNGNATSPTPAATPKSYVATVNTSSRVFVSSPEPEESPANGAGGFFQGVSDWSERSKEIRSPPAPQRPERVQVLPTGPNHTFSPKTVEVAYNNHADRASPYQHTNHIAEKTSIFQGSSSSSTQNISRSSPYPTGNHLSPDRSVSYMNGSAGRNSPFPTGRVSPCNKTVRVAHNESSLEDDGYHPSRRRSPNQRLRFSDREEREGEDAVEGYRYKSSYRSPVDKDAAYRSWDRERQEAEPPPDYSPEQPPRGTPSPSPSPPPEIRSTPPPEATSSKKLYRRPRVSADIPPPSSPAHSPSAPVASGRQGKSSGHSATSIIGESFRKLVGKFRTSSSERKNKRRNAGGKRGNLSRSPSPRHQPGYHVTDSSGSSSIPGSKAQRVGRRGGDESPLPNEAGQREAEGGESSDHQPVAPPRSARAQVSSRHYRTRVEPAMQRRFYLGEDPFGGSIYGREREYDGVTPLKSSRRHHRQQNGHRRGSHPGEEDDMNRANVSSSSLGRLSKSTSRLATGEQVTPGTTIDYSRTAQTLPRKLYDEHTQTSRLKKQVYLQKNGGTKQPHSNSMINVSIINHVTPPPSSIGVSKPLSNGVTSSIGPAKPARTYRSNLARSKSFNVHAGEPGDSPSFLIGNTFRDNSTVYKSNPHLHRLDESPPPLKSPGILASISRSQRDLSDSTTIEKEDNFTKRQDQQTKISKSTSNLITNGLGNPSVNAKTSSQEAKKRLFMRELMDRAPELYKTLHGSDDDDDLKHTDRKTSRSPVGRVYNSTPLKNGLSSSRVLEYSNSFRSSSTNATPPESDTMRGGGRTLSSPFKPNGVNVGERVTSPSGSKSSFSSSLTHTPSYTNGARRGSSSNDDYSETVRITSKLDDPVRPSVTNTVQSFSKKTIPRKGGLSTETIESTETTTVTKSRFRGGDGNGNMQYLDNGDGKYAMRNGGGGVVIEVRPTRK